MNKEKINITFFTPTLQKTGSELVLYNLLNYLPDSFNATIVSKYRGVLFYSLPDKISKDYIFKFQFPSTLLVKIYYKFFRKRILLNKLKKYKNSIWYINTIVLPEILDFAVKNNVKVIMHVHELQQMYSVLSEANLKQLLNYPKLVIANSNASKSVLEELNAKSEIKICYPAIDTKRFNFDENASFLVRKQLKISNDTFVWTMVGSIDENKNPKLFIDIAVELKKKHNKFKLMWIGSSNQGEGIEMKYKNYALEKGVEDSIFWMTQQNIDYFKYFNCANGLVLTSKLESFSLVTLEALLLGLPVVANNCIGVNEILNNVYGKVIDDEDVSKMGDEMLLIMQQPGSRDIIMGREIAEKFDIEIWQKIWTNYLNEFINNIK